MATVERTIDLETRTADRPTWEIRPGVRFPDWPAIRSSNSEGALRDILDILKIGRMWDGYGDAEDRLRRLLLQHFGTHGRAPAVDTLAALAGVPVSRAHELLARLRERDLVVFDAAQNRIAGAYPFTDRATEHRVRFGGLAVNAMCAIDALGAGAMYDRDISVASQCRACGQPISVETRGRGTRLASYAPEAAIVWSGLRYADNCAATSLCTIIAFFCSDAHLEDWRAANHPDVRGHRLSMAEAHEVGVAIFGPMLRTAA